eukprot:COSAG02_NODE_841_length_16613_cov_61.635703_7_plen_123_part_00
MVALESPGGSYNERQEVTTVALQFGRTKLELGVLELNVDTGAGGSCAVEVLDAETLSPLPGLSLAQAIPVVANGIDVRAQWQNESVAFHAAIGRAVRLRFVLQGAKLFGFGFRSVQGMHAAT